MENVRLTGGAGLSAVPAVAEDGMRTDPFVPSFEWWYCDAEFAGGTKIVVVFLTKKGFLAHGRPDPTVIFDATFPDGTSLHGEESLGKGRLLDAASDRCEVRVGKNFLVRRENGEYDLRFADARVEYFLTMKPDLPMWRPQSGRIDFGSRFFSWLVAVPSAKAEGTLTLDGKTTALSGAAYHDHNWGNADMFTMMNDWYWCRAKIGDYTIINADIVAKKRFGYRRFAIFFLAKDGKILLDDGNTCHIERTGTFPHPVTGKFLDGRIVFRNAFPDGTRAEIEYLRKTDILAKSAFHGPLAFLGRLFGLDPSYVRCVGTVRLSLFRDGKTETVETEGLWEQMFFGANREPHIGEYAHGGR